MKANKIWGKLNGMGAVPFVGKILTRKKIGFLLFKRESVFFLLLRRDEDKRLSHLKSIHEEIFIFLLDSKIGIFAGLPDPINLKRLIWSLAIHKKHIYK
jgi:hypothetical protein